VLPRSGGGRASCLLAGGGGVGEGEVRYARSPEGEGIVRAVRDIDPWQLTSAIRLHWE